jgi:uncharacterized protein (TIGR02268 family)
MSVPPYQVVPLLLLVLPAAAWAQAASLELEPLVRQLELSQTARPELWVAPGQAIVVALDAPLDTEWGRQARETEGLRRVEASERAVVLVPSAGVKEGALLEFTLRYADGQPAEGVTLLLRVDSSRAEPEVEVYRGAIPAEALKRRVDALNERLAALGARQASLSSLVAAGVLGSTGVKSHALGQNISIQGKGLTATGGWLHVANGRMALEVTLALAPGALSWVPDTVRLTEKSHVDPLPVHSMQLLGGAALQPGTASRLLVEWDTPLETEDLEYILEITERHGERAVTVRFQLPRTPAANSAPPKEKKP